jgi:hypothetical protein
MDMLVGPHGKRCFSISLFGFMRLSFVASSRRGEYGNAYPFSFLSGDLGLLG